jgi:RNA polymerase sigma-70 factor (ECF subfamily)
MESNNRRLFRVARSLLEDDAEAEDTVHLSASANLDRYAGTAALSTWLTRIALNEALGRLRRRRSMVEFDDDRAEFDAGADEAGARVIPFPLTQSTMPVSRTHSSAPI